jgi:rare lipoprotein A
MQKKISLIYFLLTILFVANLQAQSNIPMDTASNVPTLFYQEGKASYYANSLQGRRTASGEKYSKKKLTAAHLTLPLGTRVKVTNKKTGKWVIVTINDRGPYSRKYIIDLSYRAAKHLGMTQGSGHAKVVIEEQPAKDQPWPQKHIPEPAGQGLQK